MVKKTKSRCLPQANKTIETEKEKCHASVYCTQTSKPVQYAVSPTLKLQVKEQITSSTAAWKVLMMFRCLFLTNRCIQLKNAPSCVRLLL